MSDVTITLNGSHSNVGVRALPRPMKSHETDRVQGKAAHVDLC